MTDTSKKLTKIRKDIADLVKEYAAIKAIPQKFYGGDTPIPPSGKLIGVDEYSNMVEASLDGWLTTGRFNDTFETDLSSILDIKNVLTTNSGSSANLLALAALTSSRLGDRALLPGDEVITVAAGFPTTVNPLIQYGLIPVFVDVMLPTYNINPDLIEEAISKKTKAIMLAHTLGNPFDIDVIMHLAKKYNLWVIEDCCDALGSTYQPSLAYSKGRNTCIESGVERLVGTFGDLGTLSFYPAHHITMGEGGAVFTDSALLKSTVESFRDWGRDCYCAPGKDNTCNKRYCWKLGSLPQGYDHKYIYSHVGYNLKITDMQAACGLAQLGHLAEFIMARKRNFEYLKTGLKSCEEYLILPEATPKSSPSWFGFPLTLKRDKGIERLTLLQFLESRRIGTRLLFAGNVTRQPYMKDKKYRVSGRLNTTDLVMESSFWIGVQPALTTEMLDYVIESFEDFFLKEKRL
ncbi:lipopolysaccharide biosynthesis protein RfbH [Shewanella sp. SP2S2-6]|uniref:lipopolysaccharide biosynthesis protein RfbH n=1 Tax=Shewanella sp. SP2S2-6 TaxID=3063540 RepID=UPI00288F77B0|nr:lipopolysaccharide biosynthesis protein RfbH [Shewanella sp. SP2S2-6]MDT3294484.1 lipopolysaccharide biosynthesis protein RfbH [Shewanella sp. SP2S2-6]